MLYIMVKGHYPTMAIVSNEVFNLKDFFYFFLVRCHFYILTKKNNDGKKKKIHPFASKLSNQHYDILKISQTFQGD